LIYLEALVSRSSLSVSSIHIAPSSQVEYVIPSSRSAVRLVQLDASESSFAVYQSAHALFVYVAREGGVDSCHHSLTSHHIFLARGSSHQHPPSTPPVYEDACIPASASDGRIWTSHHLPPHPPTVSGLPLSTSYSLTLHRFLPPPSWT
jgi:hypothetical protein